MMEIGSGAGYQPIRIRYLVDRAYLELVVRDHRTKKLLRNVSEEKLLTTSKREAGISGKGSSLAECLGVKETSKKDGAGDGSDVNGEFGAFLNDSVSREFVRDHVVQEQVNEGKFEYPPANDAMQKRMEEGSSCVNEPQVGPRQDAQVDS